MAENVAYLKEMLEVPIEGGRSQDVCGQDDNFYAFGLWTDFCGLSDEEMRKAAIANAAGSSDCCGGGGGGDTGKTTDNTLFMVSEIKDGKYYVYVTAEIPVDTDVTVSFDYIVLYEGGLTSAITEEIVLTQGSDSNYTELTPGDGTIVGIENLNVTPQKTDKYSYDVVDNTDFEAFEMLYCPVRIIDLESRGIEAIEDVLDSAKKLFITDSWTDFSYNKDPEFEPNYYGDDEEVELEHTYVFVFLIDNELDANNVEVYERSLMDIRVDLGQSLGMTEYKGTKYRAYKTSKPEPQCVVYGPEDRNPKGYEWKYKVKKH